MSSQPFQKQYLRAEALSLVRKAETDGQLLDKAVEKYHQYLSLNPHDDNAWGGLGGAYRRKGDVDKALDSYCKAYEANPQSTYALVNIVSLRAARNLEEDREKLKTEIPEALRLCQQAIQKNTEDFWTWYDIATLQLIAGNLNQALSDFNYAIKLTPETAKENFRSVLNNLKFLQSHNPTIEGLSTVIRMISEHLT
ncbi:MAG TPA: tetratricopeptide repeat protein [Pyrinomonadaceae bacterium]|jgi:tetratricopeptide (TPR) repeat protein